MLRSRLVLALYASALFLGSFLLFLVQPMQGKVLLPLLGGAPAVWNTCMVFFQAALLLGYLYAHVIVTRLGRRTQVILHGVLLALPLLLLPPALPAAVLQSPLLGTSPLSWLIFALTLSTGPAFLAVSATSPLLQAWFNRLGHERSANPYVLYAAGNCGSLLALISYPFLIEPNLRLNEQFRLWTAGYAALVTLIAAAGVLLLATGRAEIRAAEADPDADDFEGYDLGGLDAGVALATPVGGETPLYDAATDDTSIESWFVGSEHLASVALTERLYWVLLAFVPSSLMLGVTTFMTTDVAAIPMLWLMPLTLYILSFVIVFGRYSERADRWLSRLLPLPLVATLFLVFVDYRQHMWAIIAVHLVAFFTAAVSCHGRLALRRPPPARLTEFFFCMSLGGVLGGVFNSIIAPSVFESIAEYPLLLALCCMVCQPRALTKAFRRELLWCVGAFAAFAALMRGMGLAYETGALDKIGIALADHVTFDVTRTSLAYGVPLLLALAFYRRPLRLGAAALGVAVVALAVRFDASIVHRERSFFGVLTVTRSSEPATHGLVNGGILHGEQRMKDADERAIPRSYYHPQGPLGQLIENLNGRVERPAIAGIGLGSGSLAAYGGPSNSITFFELDPNVERIARDPRYFTYVDDCLRRWCDLHVELGDGRLGMMRTDRSFDLIVVDAFSSDAIPVHLITTEALRIYLTKLNEGGVIAFHISNRYVNLEPVLYNLAKDYGLGYALRSDDGDETIGKGASTWAVVAREGGDFDKLATDERWRGLESKDGIGIWADDYANVARAFTWF